MPYETRVDGLNTVGTDHVHQCGLGVMTKLGSVSYFKLLDTAGVEHFFWFDTAGALRTGLAIPANPNTGGTVVGTQV